MKHSIPHFHDTVRAFLRRKDIVFSVRRYGVDALGSMALGLFTSLIIGLILKTAGTKLGLPAFVDAGRLAMEMCGPCIGVAVAYGLKAPALVLFGSAVTGMAGAAAGGPAGAFVAAAVGAECGKLVSRETGLDIILTPALTLLAGSGAGCLAGPGISAFMAGMGDLIMKATELQPVPMGMFVAVLMGVALTLPISSAAIAIMLNLGGLAAGAATVGCCCQLVGFAVAGYRDNGPSGLVSLGLGCSMLQVPNIIRNPRIWIPPVLASALLGPLVTTIFPMINLPEGAGMGSSGLVGQISTFAAMGTGGNVWLLVAAFHFILPGLLSWIFAEFLRRKTWIRDGDMRISA